MEEHIILQATQNSSLELSCRHCGLVTVPVVRQVAMHWGAYCPTCGQWIAWLKKPSPDWRSLPATERQLAFLARYSKANPEMTKGEASRLISEIMGQKASYRSPRDGGFQVERLQRQ